MGPWTAKASEARGQVPRTVPGPGSGSPFCPPPRGSDGGASPAETKASPVLGCLSAGAPLRRQAAWPGWRKPRPGAAHPLSTPGLSQRPEASRSPRHQGKPAFCSGAVGRVENAPLEFYKENIAMASPSHLPPNPDSCLPGFLFQLLPPLLFPSHPETRAVRRSRNFPLTQKSRRPQGRPKDSPSRQLAAEGLGGSSPAPLPPTPLRGIPGARGKASLGQPGPLGSQPTSWTLGPWAQGTSTALPWRLSETPGSATGIRPHQQDARLPAAPSSQSSGATSGPGPSAASPAQPRAPALNSALNASPALSSSFKGMAGSVPGSQARRPAHPARWQGRGWKGTGDFS